MQTMMICSPRSICSSNFRVDGAPEGEAFVDFDGLTEQGHITLAGYRMRVRKHGITSGRWTLEHDGTVLAEARKPQALRRAFEIQAAAGTAGSGTVHLRPSGLGRTFALEQEGRLLGEIRPQHAFTRRAVIASDPTVDTLTQLLAFWLTALSWRRDAAATAGGG